MTANLPLFPITRWLLRAAMVLTAIVGGVFVVALGAITVAHLSSGHLGIPASIEGIDRGDALAIGAMALASGLAGAAILFFVFRATAAIVDSAIGDDPFVDENARRLGRIGWLLVGLVSLQALTGVLIHPLAEKIEAQHAGIGNIDNMDFSVSPTGLLAILLVFVLAQIFRRGAEIRSELEGTV